MGNSSSGLELTPELTLFSLGVGAELELGFSETELELEWSFEKLVELELELEWDFENRDGAGVEWS